MKKAAIGVLIVISLVMLNWGYVGAQQTSIKSKISKCVVKIFKDDGQKYSLENIRDFVVKEIRPELSNSDKLFAIHINSDCGNENPVKVTLTMNAKNYYITELNGVDLPDRIETYNSRLGLDIDKESFVELLLDSVNYDFGKPVPDWDEWTYNEMDAVSHKQKILKMFAFVFAETARFEDAEEVLEKTFKGNCQIDWSDFDFLVHNWKNASTYVIDKKLLSEGQKLGGGISQLVSGLTSIQVEKFITALENGENFKFYNKAAFMGYEFECCGSE